MVALEIILWLVLIVEGLALITYELVSGHHKLMQLLKEAQDIQDDPD